MADTATIDTDFDPDLDPRLLASEVISDEEAEEYYTELNEEDAQFVHELVLRLLVFTEEFNGITLYKYQKALGYRLIESIIIGDGETLTCIGSRQSGKSECIANVLAALMVILPKLAEVYPTFLGKFSRGLWVGIFGPVEDQGATIWGRIVTRLTSDSATELMLDPEIDERVDNKKRGEKSQTIYLKKSGSLSRLQSCNPKAKIESKSYHVAIVDEAQDADEYTVNKSVSPMLAHYNGTLMLTGTANRVKGLFYKTINYNKRRYVQATRRGVRQSHIEWDWKAAAKENPNYRKFIAKEKARLGEESEEFQMSYCNRWMLDRGMLTTEERLEELFDNSMQVVKQWYRTPVVVGIDPARTHDSTVVTVIWVDWDHPNPFGFLEHRVLNWLEINNEEWEEQYFEIVNFLANYNIYKVGVDAQGVGGAVAERLAKLLPHCEVVPVNSDGKTQNDRWNFLIQLMQQQMLIVPGHSKTRRLKVWKRFQQQMLDAEKHYKGPYLLIEAPDEKDAHDDFVDSLAIGCAMSVVDMMPVVQQSDNPFYGRRR